MEYYGNLDNPCPLHEQPKDDYYISRHCTMQSHQFTCVPNREETILLTCVTTIIYNFMTKVCKLNIH